MSLFNIENQTVYTSLKASWNTGNSRSNLNIAFIPQKKIQPLCINFFTNNSNICNIRKANDRFSAYGLIKSSTLDSVSNKNNLPDPLANFTGSYEDKIHLSKHWKFIMN
jgi:hypothetical protein